MTLGSVQPFLCVKINTLIMQIYCIMYVSISILYPYVPRPPAITTILSKSMSPFPVQLLIHLTLTDTQFCLGRWYKYVSNCIMHTV